MSTTKFKKNYKDIINGYVYVENLFMAYNIGVATFCLHMVFNLTMVGVTSL